MNRANSHGVGLADDDQLDEGDLSGDWTVLAIHQYKGPQEARVRRSQNPSLLLNL